MKQVELNQPKTFPIDWSRITPATLYDLNQMEQRLTALINQNQNAATIMKSLTQVLDEVAAVKTVEDSLITLTGSLKTQLDAALTGVLTAEQQAKVDAIFDGLEAQKTAAANAILANTPAS